jgi:hypothetical protein
MTDAVLTAVVLVATIFQSAAVSKKCQGDPGRGVSVVKENEIECAVESSNTLLARVVFKRRVLTLRELPGGDRSFSASAYPSST